MSIAGDGEKPRYTCSDYRDEMRLLGLTKRLARPDLSEEERATLTREIRELETRIGMG